MGLFLVNDIWKFILYLTGRNWDSVVAIVTGYMLDDREVISSSSGVKNFHFSMLSRPALGSTQWVLGLKWQGHEADHLPQTSSEVKKMWICTSTPPYIFMA
jgi:hypothetical protein